MNNVTASSPDASSPRAPQSARRGRGRLFRWIFFVILLVLLYWLGPRLLSAFGEWWVVSDPLEKADAIVVPDDDSYSALRCSHAAELYRAGWAPRVVAIGRYLRPYASLADVMRRDLIERGVPDSAIVVLSHSPGISMNEAETTRALVAGRGWKRLLIVTSSYQSRRDRRFFRHALDGIAEVRIVATADAGFIPAEWWRHRSSIAAVAREFIYYLTTE
ncbi:MAG TPA: YdcF family protein [Acidobacteriota bacterium]